MAVFIKSIFKIQKQEIKKQNARKQANLDLVGYLKAYNQNLTINVDDLWIKVDVDHNGHLDKNECAVFFSELLKYTIKERAQHYNEANFDALFERFDEDKNGFIEKSEMAVFIKQVFSRNQDKIIEGINEKEMTKQLRLATETSEDALSLSRRRSNSRRTPSRSSRRSITRRLSSIDRKQIKIDQTRKPVIQQK